jgi:hypothetical protein
MEAATPLRQPNVRVIGDRLVIDGLVVADECAVRLVRDREEQGGDVVKLVTDAVEIGARVLDREQTGANAEFVKTEFERAARELNAEVAERSRAVSEDLTKQLDAVFGPESGQLAKSLERHFSEGSTEAVQHRVKEIVVEVMGNTRQELLRQFTAEGGLLADFKAGTHKMIETASAQQHAHLRAMSERIAALQVELEKLRGEEEKRAALEAEHEKGTAKGREYEDVVAEEIDRIANALGDSAEAVGDVKGVTGKTGDVLVAIDACNGPARGRIVFEAKNKRLSRPDALRELDRGLVERDASFAVLVVPAEEKVPAKMAALREYNGDKLVVTFDPDEGPLALELAYKLARARVLMARGTEEGIDTAAVRETVERAVAVMEEVRRIKSQLTGATTSIESARSILDSMAERVRGHLKEIDVLLEAPAAPEAEAEAGTADTESASLFSSLDDDPA